MKPKKQSWPKESAGPDAIKLLSIFYALRNGLSRLPCPAAALEGWKFSSTFILSISMPLHKCISLPRLASSLAGVYIK